MIHNRVALFTTFLGGGGAERITVNLAEGLLDYGINVDLVVTRTGPWTYVVPKGVRVVDIGAPRIYASLPSIIRYLRHERPAALLSAGAAVNVTVLFAWRIARVPARVVIAEHNMLHEQVRNTKDWRMRLLPKFVRWSYPWADTVVAVSNGVADGLLKIVPFVKSKLRVIYNPVITPEILAKAEEPLNHPWFAPGEPPVILGAGRLTAQKDFPTLIRAFDLVRKELPARLLILGEGSDRSQLEALVRELRLERDIAMPGFVQNPYPYMRRASVFALSSRWEGLPTVLVEAMACDCPVVSTNCPSGPAEILEDGKWGRLVTVGDYGGLGKAILSTINSPRKNVRERAAFFSLERSVNEYLRVLFPQGVPGQ